MKITPFEKACKKLGINPTLLPGVEGLPELTAKQVIAGYKLGMIHKATNGNWVADFNDYRQYKYTAWLEYSPSLRRFVYSVTYYTFAYTYFGARFWFADGDTAVKFTKQNIALINDLHQE